MQKQFFSKMGPVALALVAALLLASCSSATSSVASSSQAESTASDVITSSVETSVAASSSELTSSAASSETSSVTSVAASSEVTSSTTSSTDTSSTPVVTPTTTGSITYDSTAAGSLLTTINAARTTAGKTALTADSGLDKVAQAYADTLYTAGSDFRKTNGYKTLPSGEKVSTLVKSTGYAGTISNFNFSAYVNDSTVKSDALGQLNTVVLASSQYTSKAVGGDYTKVGIACGTISDANGTSYTTIILIFSK